MMAETERYTGEISAACKENILLILKMPDLTKQSALPYSGMKGRHRLTCRFRFIIRK